MSTEEPPKDSKEIRSRTQRPTNSVHVGDVDFEVDDTMMDATWAEVGKACCVHSGEEWGMIFVGVLAVLFFLYFFLFGLGLLGDSAKVMGGCEAGELFGDDTNPIAGLMVGILATVLLQSSSTTTSIVVSLVGSVINVNQGIYMIMGANIGTSVTNTIIAMAQMGDGDQLERAFGGAVVHDLFNFLTVICLLPIEVITGYLAALTSAMVRNTDTEKGDKWEGPIKKLVSPLSKKIIIANKNVIKGVAGGESCDDYYPINCTDGIETYDTCDTGLISCNKKTDECPAFFTQYATKNDDKVSGGVCFFIAIVIMFVCLIGLVTCLQKMLLGMSTRIIYKATNVNGYLAIVIGAGVTMIVQSSSITTSALTPLVGIGVLRLEQMLPLTLGANIGTTLTAIMAALVASGTDPLQVALAHLFFNITGILIWYPIPFMRRIPLQGARTLGKATRLWRGFPVAYIFFTFFIVPLLFLGLSSLYEQHTIGYTVLGAFITILAGLGLIYAVFWWYKRGGRERTIGCFETYERKRVMYQTLPDDLDYLKAKVGALVDHTGLPDDEEGGQEEEVKPFVAEPEPEFKGDEAPTDEEAPKKEEIAA